MQQKDILATQRGESIIATNSVLRNTYLLLALTLAVSSLTAGWAMINNAQPLSPFIVIIGYFALLFLTTYLRNSGWGIVSIFALTGFMGYTLGPILSMVINNYSNGSTLVMQAFGGTAIIFFALSAYALVSKKDFSFMRSFLLIGAIVAFIAALATLFFHIPALNMAVSAAFMLISGGLILYQTSEIIRGGETNYIMATITLYVSIYNLFISLLNILTFFSGSRD